MIPTPGANPTLLQSAWSALNAGDLARAVDLCETVLKGAPKQPDALLLRGILHHRAGEAQQAERAVERALAVQPNYPYAHFIRGLNRLESGRPASAVPAFRRALELDPNFAPAWSTLGAALRGIGRAQDALDACERAIALMPTMLASFCCKADALADLGRFAEADACARQLVARAPGDPRAWRTLAYVLERAADLAGALDAAERWRALEPGSVAADTARARLYNLAGRHAEASTVLESALARAPDNADTHATLGLVKTSGPGPGAVDGASALERYEEAIAHFERAHALSPDDPGVLVNLGNALRVLGRRDEAIAAYQRVLAQSPDHLEALNNLGDTRLASGDVGAATTCFERALAIRPDYALALHNLGLAEMTIGRTASAIERFQTVVDRSGDASMYSNLLHALHYLPDITPEALLLRHRRYDDYVPVEPCAPHRNVPDPERPLRVGYVSGDLGLHPVGHFLAAVIGHHDKSRIETFCYSGRPSEDAVGQRIRAHAGRFRRTIGMSDAALVELIRGDGIDVLVDLSGHTMANRLAAFARKPAPVQATWAGYVGTTGLKAMDWLIADGVHVPPDLERFHSERVYRMPNGYVCYAPPTDAPPAGPLPAERNGYVTFCSFANPMKINGGTIATWARILATVPGARLCLRYKGLDAAPNVRRIHDGFAEHGVAPERVTIEGGGDQLAMMRAYDDADIALDTFPYSGGLTTCEALWMGVPVVTWPGDRFESRHSLGHLSNAGITETTARDLDDYVAVAAALARDLPRLAALRRDLRPRMAASPLCDAERFARDLDAAFRAMWRDWCEPPRL